MIKNKILLLLLLASAPSALFPQIINKEPLSPRNTGYKISATLDAGAKTVSGKMDAFWVNHSNDTVREVRIHLYMNAFSSKKSTFITEAGNERPISEADLGKIDMTSLADGNGNDLMPLMSFISPDDDNPDDRTVLKVDLPEPAMPGDTVFLKTEFITKLPRQIVRTGYNDDFFFVAQWFPKFGVYEPAGMRYAKEGGWNCHQFHRNSEFYADHSVYDIEITVPENYIVGTCGMLLNEKPAETGTGLKTQSWRAEDIVDFAWTAWPGYAVYTDQWKHVKITLLIPPERSAQVARQFTAIKNALEYLTENVGPYPWPHVTIVDPPAKGAGCGGMEYTTMFTSESSYGVPSFMHVPEMVTVHEFGHAFFMGILASNEFEEPWMDEGMNSFWEERIMDHYYGEKSGMLDLPILKIPDKASARSSYVTSRGRQLVTNNEFSWNYPDNTYGMMSYNKASVWLYSLMGLVGEETMNEIYREYYSRWAFRHPCATDFINIVNEVVKDTYGDKFGKDMNWFFDQTLYGTGICDYRILEIVNSESEQKSDSDSTVVLKTYTSKVKAARTGEVILPVNVLLKFDDGTEETRTWDGKERYHEWTFMGRGEIVSAIIDPEYKNRMDVNFINNSRTVDPDPVPLKRITSKAIMAVQFLLSLILL